MKRNVTIKYFLILIIFFALMSISNISNAAEYTNISNRWFYIKNSYTGHYLDVDNGFGQAGTNVQQCEFNGSYAQKWYIAHMGDGEYMICTMAGSYVENGITYLPYALDVVNGTNANGTNIHIWDAYQNSRPQVFLLQKTQDSTYIIKTKCSDYTKVVSLSNNVCSDGVNIHQWEYSNHSHDEWILEPVENTPILGYEYAWANAFTRLDAYPDFQFPYYDCTNFVSQCLLAGGNHQSGDWFINRKNTTYHTVTNNTQLDTSWELSNPSPWISANEFKEYFMQRKATYVCTGKEILDNPELIFGLSFGVGDVLQYADKDLLGGVGEAQHTMYMTGSNIGQVNNISYLTYNLTYHSTDTREKDLLSIAANHQNDKFIFYDFTY